MGIDHSNPYIHSTTELCTCDIQLRLLVDMLLGNYLFHCDALE